MVKCSLWTLRREHIGIQTVTGRIWISNVILCKWIWKHTVLYPLDLGEIRVKRFNVFITGCIWELRIHLISSNFDSCEILPASIRKLQFGKCIQAFGNLKVVYFGTLSPVPLRLHPVIYNKGSYMIFSGITTGFKLLLNNHLEHVLELWALILDKM